MLESSSSPSEKITTLLRLDQVLWRAEPTHRITKIFRIYCSLKQNASLDYMRATTGAKLPTTMPWYS